MRCRACGLTLGAEDEYCSRCGSRIAGREGQPRKPQSPNRSREFLARGRSHPDDDDEEFLLWRGSFSWKGLVREAILAAIATVVLLYFRETGQDPILREWAFPAIGLIWLGLFLWLVYRKLDVTYRLTNQRLLHERGILYRRNHRVEVIDIDDLSFEQGLIERVINVGRIRVATSDVSDRDLLMPGIDRPREVYETIEKARRQERMRYGVHVEAV